MFTVCTAAERPDLWKISNDAPAVWPEYNLHGDVIASGGGAESSRSTSSCCTTTRPDAVLAGPSGPLAWDGEDETLPAGIDQVSSRSSSSARTGGPANAVRAGRRDRPGRPRPRAGRPGAGGHADPCAAQRAAPSDRAGAAIMEGPLPARPIERYIPGGGPTAQLLDPWMRLHERLGARVATPLPTLDADHRHGRRVGGLDRAGLPGIRRLRLPGRAAPLTVDSTRRPTAATYWEPNVWLIHPDIRRDTPPARRLQARPAPIDSAPDVREPAKFDPAKVLQTPETQARAADDLLGLPRRPP